MKHIIIIGFKHAGKSAIGETLAQKIKRPFCDLDDLVEKLHFKKSRMKQLCREIMNTHGQDYFHELEVEALKEILVDPKPLVIAVGGGTPINKKAREMMKLHTIILVSAPLGIIYERIMINGRPAFFPKEGNSYEAFQKIFKEREPVFNALAHIRISNSGSINDSAENLITLLENHTNIQ